jgi:hypothetical protein
VFRTVEAAMLRDHIQYVLSPFEIYHLPNLFG